MAPPLNKQQEDILNKLYDEDGLKIGIEKLYAYTKEHYTDAEISYRQIKAFLQSKPEYQMHSRLTKVIHIKPILTTKPLKLIQLDLIDYSGISAPESFKYVINIIDVFSRKIWLFKSKNKKPETILKIFEDWYDSVGKPENLRLMTDNGGEFVLLKGVEGLKHIISSMPQVNGVVERNNQTVRRLIDRLITKETSSRFSLLPIVEKVYNTTIHNALSGYTPNQVFEDEKLWPEIRKNQVSKSEKVTKKRLGGIPNSSKPLEIGDNVRIGKIRKDNSLDKDQTHNYSQGVYKVVKIIKSNHPIGFKEKYKLEGDKGVLKQLYYREQLLLIPYSDTSEEEDELPESSQGDSSQRDGWRSQRGPLQVDSVNQRKALKGREDELPANTHQMMGKVIEPEVENEQEKRKSVRQKKAVKRLIAE
jgi:hypothetical protein